MEKAMNILKKIEILIKIICLILLMTWSFYVGVRLINLHESIDDSMTSLLDIFKAADEVIKEQDRRI